MGRPTKKEIEIREKILNLNLFQRDSSIYTLFEELYTNNLSSLADEFSIECLVRDSNNHLNENGAKQLEVFFSSIDKDKDSQVSKFIQYLNSNGSKKQNDIIKNYLILENINKDLAKYFRKTLQARFIEYSKQYGLSGGLSKHEKKDYLIQNEINHNLLLKDSLSNERYEYFQNNLGSLFNLGLKLFIKQSRLIGEPLTNDEKNNILNKLNMEKVRKDKTFVIKPPNLSTLFILENKKNKHVYVELDLTKPKEEIIEYISKMKDDFNEDPSKFETVYEILGEKIDTSIYDLETSEIYKDPRSKKSTAGRLADALFIYDCKKINELSGMTIFKNQYIADEIDRYWIDEKKVLKEMFHSLESYHKITKEHIDNKGYSAYLTGIK